jgi:hypothetical protein
MARIRIHTEDDDSLPDLANLLKAIKSSPRKRLPPTPRQPVERSASDSRQVNTSDFPKPKPKRFESDNDKEEKCIKPRQRALKKVENNARLATVSKEKVKIAISEDRVEKETLPGRAPRRVARSKVQEFGLSNSEDIENDAESKTKKAVKRYQYDSDDSLPSPSKLFSKPQLPAPLFEAKPGKDLKAQSPNLDIFTSLSLPLNAASKTTPALPPTSRPTSSSDNDKSAFLIL